MGDAREAEKDALYADMAKECAMEFCAVVLYTYGGFDASALAFIQRMAKAVDPATCLTSPTRWRRELMEQMAIAVQRGNADIMITAAQRMRGKAWVQRRRPHSAPRRCDRSRSRVIGRGEARSGDSDCDEEQQLLPDRGRAMSCVARFIGLSVSDHEATCCERGSGAVDSDAETEVEDGGCSPSLPSFIPETPLSRHSGQEEDMEVSAPQREETGECGVPVGVEVAGDHGHHPDVLRGVCMIGATVTAVGAVVVSGDAMEAEEEVSGVRERVGMSGDVMMRVVSVGDES